MAKISKLNNYLFSLLLISFTSIGIAHAEKLAKYQCYLSNANGQYVNLKGKRSETPVYAFEFEGRSNRYIISNPDQTEDFKTRLQDKYRIISFTHKYLGKPPCSIRKVEMADQWELRQITHNTHSWNLTITYDIKHNIMDNTRPRQTTHLLSCSKS